ncbi:hypothetical protein BTHE68_39890 [Burkholderia sp. THE68]|nr:hypothetical protein BTHE68_39890 [Burkholderia sp. THE68]
MWDSDTSPSFPDRNGSGAQLGQEIVERGPGSNRARVQFKSHSLKKAYQLHCRKFLKLPGLETANLSTSHSAAFCSALLRVFRRKPGPTEGFAQLEEVHVSPQTRHVPHLMYRKLHITRQKSDNVFNVTHYEIRKQLTSPLLPRIQPCATSRRPDQPRKSVARLILRKAIGSPRTKEVY